MNRNPSFNALEELVVRMGAEPSSWQLTPYLSGNQKQVRKNLESGIDVSIDEVNPEAGGLLTYKGEQVVLYIKQTRQNRYILQNRPEDAKRFHVYECTTLAQMRKSNRFERYVATTRKDGWFLVEDVYGDEIEAQLHVCKNCLWSLNWKNYRVSLDINDELWKRFSLQDFFAEYDTFFRPMPTYSDQTEPPGSYGKDWSRIAFRAKERHNWRCQQCGVNLFARAYRHLLHVHHRSGVTRNNRPGNLAVLCIVCHAGQPYHVGRIRPSGDERRIIEKLKESGQF